jgi:hypothetical protein
VKWFDNMIERAMDRVRSRLSNQLPRQGALHSSSNLSDILNGRVCAMVYSIDNGFILVNPDPTSGASKFVHAKDAVEVGEIVARQLTLQRMDMVQGSSIRGAGVTMQANTLTANRIYAESQAKVSGF